jgi:hypothetical protein
MALAGRHFEVTAVYLPKHSPEVVTGLPAAKIVKHVEGAPVRP